MKKILVLFMLLMVILTIVDYLKTVAKTFED